MTPTPIALGMSFCDYVILEEGTEKASLIGCFGALAASAFPSRSHSFFVYTDLTDGLGRGVADLTISRLDSGETIHRQVKIIDFPSRFSVVRYSMKVGNCRFPIPGAYLVTLEVDRELVAQRGLDLKLKGGPS
jgi:hypothetical protein